LLQKRARLALPSNCILHHFSDLIDQLLTSIHDCWSNSRSNFPPVSLHSIIKAHDFVSLSHDAVRFLVEQLPGARHCPRYKAKYHKLMKIKEGVSLIPKELGCPVWTRGEGLQMPDVRSFWCKKFKDFRNLCIRTDKGKGLRSCRHFAYKEVWVNFLRFYVDVFYGRPLIIVFNGVLLSSLFVFSIAQLNFTGKLINIL